MNVRTPFEPSSATIDIKIQKINEIQSTNTITTKNKKEEKENA